MTKKSKILISVGLILIGIIIVAYFFSSIFENIGLCKPGRKYVMDIFGKKFCYSPKDYGNIPCKKQTDCKGGICLLLDEKRVEDGGICSKTFPDLQLIDKYNNPLSIRVIDKNGYIQPPMSFAD